MREADAWNLVKNARSRERKKSIEYIERLFSGFIELKGDRISSDDKAILTGLAWYKDTPVTIIACRKGTNIEEDLLYNYGMASPSGYRKALRVAKQAERFKRCIVIFVDTPGAYPGIEAEENGQAEAIGKCILEFLSLKTKVISFIISEGCSGGALALYVADKLYMLEKAYFSILSPEGYSSILWRNSDFQRAANEMNITATSLKERNIIDGIIKEKEKFELTVLEISNILDKEIVNTDLIKDNLLENRYKKFRYIEKRKKQYNI